MKEKFLLYLTEEEISLYEGADKKIASFKGSFEEIVPTLETHLPSKSSLCLLIDRNQQDIHEEKLPSLFFWDRARLLFHKKAILSLEGGYAGFQFLKQDGDRHLRWVHLPQQDPIVPWIDFVKTHSGHIFFLSLAGGQFLKTRVSLSKKYNILLYTCPSQKTRHIVFKGRRLLLSRLSHGEEDVKGSLHFLSRTYADIHDNLEVLTCDAYALIAFLGSQKKPSFPLSHATFSYALWVRRATGVFLSFISLWIGVELYDGFDFKSKLPPLVSEVSSLKEISQVLTSRLKSQDVHKLQRAVAQYEELIRHKRDPLKDIEQLSSLLKMYRFYLENVEWRHEQRLEIFLSFLMKDNTKREVLTEFESFLLSAQEHFPHSQIQVLEAPFNSSPHETFKDPPPKERPRVHLRIVDP